MTLKELMSKSNNLMSYAFPVLRWFLKALHLKPGRKTLASWAFLVSPADFCYSKHLLKELAGGDFTLADIIDWSSLDN